MLPRELNCYVITLWSEEVNRSFSLVVYLVSIASLPSFGEIRPFLEVV